MQALSFTEKKGISLRNNGTFVLFVPVDDNQYIRASYSTSLNPKWNIFTLHSTFDGMIDYIHASMNGWFVEHTEFPINIDHYNKVMSMNEVADIITEIVINDAIEHNFNPVETTEILHTIINTVATNMKFIITTEKQYNIIQQTVKKQYKRKIWKK